MKTNWLIVSIFYALLLLLSSCHDNLCPEPYDNGTFDLTIESEELFPYGDVKSKIVFVDSLGIEVYGFLDTVRDEYSLNEHSVICSQDNDQRIQAHSRTQSISAVFLFPELDIRLTVGHYLLADFEDPDGVKFVDVSAINIHTLSGSFPIASLSVLLDQRTWIEPFITVQELAIDTILLNGLEFHSIYFNEISHHDFTIYYNIDIGVVGIKNNSTGKILTFDRME